MGWRGGGETGRLSQKKLCFLKSQDSWGEGVVYDEVELDVEGFATAVTVAGEDRVYVFVWESDGGYYGKL